MDVNELKRIQKQVIKKSRIINFILVVIWGLSIYAISRLKNIDFILFFSDTILIIVIGAIIRFLILNKQIIKFIILLFLITCFWILFNSLTSI